MTAASTSQFCAGTQTIAILNIIFAIFQLFLVGFGLGQTSTVIAVKLALKEADNAIHIEFNGPFIDSLEGNYMFASGLSFGVYLTVASLLHLTIAILLLVGAKQKSRSMCQCWFVITAVFLIGYVSSSMIRIFLFSSVNKESLQRILQILVEIFFAALIQAFQLFIVYSFVNEETLDSESSIKSNSDLERQITVDAVDCVNTDASLHPPTHKIYTSHSPPCYYDIDLSETYEVKKEISTGR